MNSNNTQKTPYREKKKDDQSSDNIYTPLVKTQLFGVDITNATNNEILEYIIRTIEKTTKKFFIVTPNPEILVYANAHKDFKNILNTAELALCDGVGLAWAGGFLSKPFKSRVTGVDTVRNLCEKAANRPITVGFLGGWGNVAEQTVECLIGEYPSLKVTFVGEEWNEEGFVRAEKYNVAASHYGETKNAQNASSKIRNAHHIDILFVAFGFPKQERWMYEHLGKVDVRVMMGVGGAFDFLSGKVSRAPGFVQTLGFEWLFRLMVQPWRIKRQLALLTFAWMVMKEKLGLDRLSA